MLSAVTSVAFVVICLQSVQLSEKVDEAFKGTLRHIALLAAAFGSVHGLVAMMTFLEFDATYISTVLLFLTAVMLVGLWGALHAKAFLDARPTKLSRQTFTVVDTEAPASPTSGDISNGFIEMEKNADISLEIKCEEPKELKIQKIEEKNADISLEIKYEEPQKLKTEAPLPPPPFLLDGQMHLQILRRDRRSRRARLASINEETAVDTPKWMAYLGSYMANEVLPRVPTGQEHTWETVCDTMTALAKWLRSDDAEHLSKAFRPCFGFSCERCGIAVRPDEETCLVCKLVVE